MAQKMEAAAAEAVETAKAAAEIAKAAVRAKMEAVETAKEAAETAQATAEAEAAALRQELEQLRAATGEGSSISPASGSKRSCEDPTCGQLASRASVRRHS